NFKEDDVFVYIQMKLYEKSLAGWLKELPSFRPRPQMKSWFKQIVTAVQYLHEKEIIHRDLKPDNIMFVENDRIKLCDLGIATERTFENGEEISTLRSHIYTALYMSPEQKSSIPIYSSKTDIFALGLILSELCVVMNDDERKKIFDGYRKGESQKHIFDDEETAKFVAFIAEQNSKKRPTCGVILDHPFL
ncbi:hypothetical protein PENTCL1PPCAC_8522, partial [Pristionchus entomophagus]